MTTPSKITKVITIARHQPNAAYECSNNGTHFEQNEPRLDKVRRIRRPKGNDNCVGSAYAKSSCLPSSEHNVDYVCQMGQKVSCCCKGLTFSIEDGKEMK